MIVMLILTQSCNSQPVTTGADNQTGAADSTKTEDPGIAAMTLPEDFNEFFKRFHDDTAFQMAHITFPLEGLPNAKGDSDTIAPARFFWQRADWKIHKPFTDPGGNFQQWFEMKGPRVVEHWILLRGTDMYIYRRFAKLEDGWYLIYYQGLRPTVR